MENDKNGGRDEIGSEAGASAAALAQNRAEAAATASIVAQGRAEPAATAAEAAKGKAEVAATASLAAQDRAEPAATAAETAQAKAEAAATASVAAQGRAEPAATAAEAAQGKAATAATASAAAQARSEPAATAAETARGKAEAAAAASIAAQGTSEPAATAAEIAQGKAEAAATASLAAQGRSEPAATAAEIALSKAAPAASAAEFAQSSAEFAQKEVEKAAAEAAARLKEIRLTLDNSITASLGGAFQLKADNAKWMDLGWLIVLIVGIVAIIGLGYLRYPATTALITERAEIEYLFFQLLFSLATLSGPIWLAWVATKRLAKMFAISEDYAYKAALAQAYQGYRDSAKDADPLMQQRLFATVITQLDASPVRFLSDQHPATPFQDLLQQPWMEEVMKDRQFKEKFMEWFKYKYGTIFDIPKPP